MDTLLRIVFIMMLGVQQAVNASESPLHPEEAKIVERIIAVEGHVVEVAEMPGWAKAGVINRLRELGVETSGLKSWGVRDMTRKAVSFGCICDSNGRVLALTGNGPWLRDESLRALRGMPELRIIRFDHNGLAKNDPESPLYRGVGFDALLDSKLVDMKLTLGLSDAGMEQASRIRGLKSIHVLHSQVSEAGVKFFEGHPSLESFSIAEMGHVSDAALECIAGMPKVEHVGFHEAFVTYDGGLKHLLSMKGRLKTLDLSMSLVNAADLERVRSDHPGVKITTIPPDEIVKRHRFVAGRLARIAHGEAAEELKKAIAEYDAHNNPSR